MGQALYRTYRSKKLSEIIGQEHITSALERSLKNGTISHAYLFTGPKGIGKTSTARILAHDINGLPYEDDAIHLDIIEIDAASNRRIDEIRELRDKVHIAPTSAKYKVYIIDEVHMLTKEAFNALLKTLEEPPEHVVFILATTEAHKLPETIISRTQRYAFKPVDLPKVIDHLKSIAKAEKITVDDEALALIAAHGEGSFRDSISLLDQIRNSGERITLADVQASLGIASKELIEGLVGSVSAHDAPQVIQHLEAAHAAGHEPARMAKQLGETLRAQLLAGKATLPNNLLMDLLAKLIEVPSSGDPKSNLEVALLDIALAGDPTQKKPTKTMHEEVQTKPPVQVDPHPAIARKRAAETEVEDGPLPKSGEGPALDKTAWAEILAAIKKKHNTLYGIIRTTRPSFEPGAITLECGYAFHQKKLNEKVNKKALAEIVKTITGQDVQLNSIVGEAFDPSEAPPPLPPTDEKVHTVTKKPDTEEVKTISNIFGGAELLES